MCRFVAYLGPEVLLEDILVKPINSIVMQSLHARESHIPTNGDGFGLGWYVPNISPEPALFTSVLPAWNDRNLLHLTAKIKSPCFFAHVRAASAGGVSNFNCHPFVHGPWMLMHNGQIANFIMVKRHIRHLLDDDIYHWIQGETDSEHLFALFLQLSKGKDLTALEVVAELLQEAFAIIHQLVEQFSTGGTSFYNVCLTDGRRVLATRYCSNPDIISETLYYSCASWFVGENGHARMQKANGGRGSVLVASEKLTNVDADWQDVPDNHFLMVDADLHIKLRAL